MTLIQISRIFRGFVVTYCVPKVGGWMHMILEEVHCFKYFIHSGAVKMYHDLRKLNWWSCMKRDIMDIVAKCLKCQQVIYKHQTAGGAMQMIRILEWNEEHITVDFYD